MVMAATAAACSTSSASVDHATLGMIDYSVPSGWTAQNGFENAHNPIVIWTPPDNMRRKESVTIMRTDPRPALAKAGPDKLARFLAQAELGLSRARFGVPQKIVTSMGLEGVRVEGDFVPDGQSVTYHRLHAVLIDGEALIHVTFTATIPDHEPFDIVVNSITRREG
jgi:hypothetical protein